MVGLLWLRSIQDWLLKLSLQCQVNRLVFVIFLFFNKYKISLAIGGTSHVGGTINVGGVNNTSILGPEPLAKRSRYDA